MNIEFGMSVVDSEGVTLGEISKVITDTWSGEVRKYVVRRQSEVTSYFFTPAQVGEVRDSQVRLKVSRSDIDFA